MYVDLGLPSGLLWAKRNIDLTQSDKFASSEYTYNGSFFSWGNTEGYNPSGTTFSYNFTSENYATTQGAALTGDIDFSHDAARVNLGAPWRMPTESEYAELFNSAYTKFIDANGNDISASNSNKLITINGITGIRLKSLINGNTLFFPCSGNGTGNSLSGSASKGFYWSSSLYSNNTAYAKGLSFYNIAVSPSGGNNRYFGFAIRPVM